MHIKLSNIRGGNAYYVSATIAFRGDEAIARRNDLHGGEFKFMAVKKIEYIPRRLKITSSAVTPGRNPEEEPPASAEHIETSDKGEDIWTIRLG
jgi:hypothetical protein